MTNILKKINKILFENIKKVEGFEEFKINRYNWQSNNFKDPIIFKFRPSKYYRYREFNYFQIEYKNINVEFEKSILEEEIQKLIKIRDEIKILFQGIIIKIPIDKIKQENIKNFDTLFYPEEPNYIYIKIKRTKPFLKYNIHNPISIEYINKVIEEIKEIFRLIKSITVQSF